jgi:hypothetical protein
MPKTQRRINLEEFVNTFLEIHIDKMHEINQRDFVLGVNTVIEWVEDSGCKWHLRKCSVEDDKGVFTEYFLRRKYPALTKSITERIVFDECWIYPVVKGKGQNDSRNMTVDGYYFQGHSGYRPRPKALK